MTLRRRLTCRFSGTLPKNVVQVVYKGLLLGLVGWVSAWSSISHAQDRVEQLPPVVEGEYALVALRVEFQPDENPYTSGNGTFGPGSIPYLEELSTNIDPLPHDASYVKSHLDFAATYFERQSIGRVSMITLVLPEIIRVSKPMEAYSPIGDSPTNEPLAELTHEAWSMSASLGAHQSALQGVLDQGIPAENVIFVMVHAGIGRDIELSGTTLEKTPQDLPSVFLDQEALVELSASPNGGGFAESGFDGSITTGVPGLNVTHGMLIPRTQTRKGFYINNEPFLVPLSINGMLSAQIGSYFGLPDLFNTQTGESGIGRFGLMDGAGIFAVAGLFPPNLSAWEKQWLGWVEPQTVSEEQFSSFGLASVSLAAAQGQTPGDVLRIETLAADYFLVENRHRNPSGEPISLTFRLPDGTEQIITRSATDSLFSVQVEGFDQSLPKGVLVDVSHYDVALPGGLDVGEDGEAGTTDDRDLLGGVLVWHIQPGKIAEALRAGVGVNDNPESRGVDLEEADGAQDIGYQTQVGVTIFDPSGSAFDFWWRGNDARVIRPGSQDIQLFTNRFDGGSIPSNHSALGAPTWFELFDFSDTQPVATFSLRRATENQDLPWLQRLYVNHIQDPVPPLMYHVGHELVSWESSSWSFAWFATTHALWELQWPATTGSYSSGSVQLQKVAEGSYGSLLFDGNQLIASYMHEGQTMLKAFPCQELTGCSTGLEFTKPTWETPVPSLRGPLRFVDETTITSLYSTWHVDATTGEVLPSLGQPFLQNRIDGFEARWVGSSIDIQTPSASGRVMMQKDLFALLDASFSSTGQPNPSVHPPKLHWIQRRNTSGDTFGYDLVVYAEGTLSWIDLSEDSQQWTLRSLSRSSNPAVFPSSVVTSWMDLDQDQTLDWIHTHESDVMWTATNLEGAVVDGFPWSSQSPLLTSTTWIDRPLGLRLNERLNSDGSTVESSTTSGSILSSTDIVALPHYIDGTIALEPLAMSTPSSRLRPVSLGSASGTPGEVSASLQFSFVGDELVSVSPSGEVALYRLPANADVAMGQSITPWAGKGSASTLLEGVASEQPADRLLLTNEVYNWPNPASDETNIRVLTSAAATVQVHVITMAGVTRYKGELQTRGIAPAEISIDTSDWSSGIYIVRVSARSADGTSKDHHQFNLAIIR